MLSRVRSVAIIIMLLLWESTGVPGDEKSSVTSPAVDSSPQEVFKKLQMIITGNTGGFSSWTNEIIRNSSNQPRIFYFFKRVLYLNENK